MDQTIAGDLFEALYDWDPQLKGSDDNPSPAVAEFVRQLREQDGFKTLRQQTVGDKARASAGAARLYREMGRTSQGQKSTLSTIADFKDRVDTFDALTDDPNDSTIQSLREAEKVMAEQYKEQGIPDMQKPDGQSHVQGSGSDAEAIKAHNLVSALSRTNAAMQMAEDLTDFEGDVSRGFSLGGPLSEHLVGQLLDESMAQSFANSDKLKYLLKIAGRMHVVLQQEKSKKPKAAPPPIGLTVGSDLSAVLPQELVLLADEETEGLFYQRYLDGGLVSYDRKAKVREGRGPLVICCDISGSMNGRPETMAYSMFIAMAREAIKRGRRALFIPFASRPGQPLEVKHATDLFRLAGYKPNVGGGTDFAHVLNAAMTEIEEAKGKWKAADIVLITDGHAHVYEDWLEKFQARQKATGARLIGVMISGSKWQPELQGIMNSAINVNDAGDINDLEWFRSVSAAVI